jgi:hypothetical protein
VLGAKTTMMVVGTATAVGLALINDRRLQPIAVGAASPDTPVAPVLDPRTEDRRIFDLPDVLSRHLSLAARVALGVLVLAAAVPAVSAFASGWRTAPSQPAAYGPPAELRASSGIVGNWERSYMASQPTAGSLGSLLIAGVKEQQGAELIAAMKFADAEHQQRLAQARAAAPPAGRPYSVNGASGVGAGTILRARITIYGCVGPGGGFCGNMSSGGRVFEGAAACSNNLPFGTRLRIIGDPTGRVYECLDRGALPATWVDVFFYNTSDGMRWQGNLGGTMADIEIVN